MATFSSVRFNWLLKGSLLVSSCFGLFRQSQGQFLKVSGTQITNGSDTHFILRSMGLGGYMLQEGYMFHLGFLGTQTKIREKINNIVGQAQTEAFYKQWRNKFIQQADIDSMAAWGFNAIRLPMHYNLFTLPVEKEPVAGRNTWLPEGFQLVDSLLNWCSKAHIYLILDLHAAPGGQGNDLPISDRDPGLPSLWQSGANQDKTIALWEKLAHRYKDEPYIGGYDLLNETNWGFEDTADIRGTNEQHNVQLWRLLEKITAGIRKHDQRHMIILEGNGFANNYRGLERLWDNNMVLSFHKYGNFNDQKSIQSFLELRTRLNAPIWLGESGENSNNWYMHCIQLMEDNQIGWSWWPWKKMGLNNPLEIKAPENYKDFVRYAAGKGPEPDRATMEKLLRDLTTNIQIQHNIIHRDVIDAMFRRVHHPEAIPFKHYTLNHRPCYVLAADYDLGANGYAYLDKDTARYQYTPGVRTDGNKGNAYRNDGVDIKIDSASAKPYIFSIQDGEWLLYTLDIKKAGKYQLQLDYRKAKKPALETAARSTIDILRGEKLVGTIELDMASATDSLFTVSQPVSLSFAQMEKQGQIKIVFKSNTDAVQLRGLIFKPVRD